MMRIYKIEGVLYNIYESPEGNYIQPKCVKYARNKITLAIKIFIMRFLFDEVVIKEREN